MRSNLIMHLTGDTRANAPELLHSPTSAGKSPANLPGSPFYRGDALKDSSPPLNSSAHQFSAGLHELKFQFSGKLQLTKTNTNINLQNFYICFVFIYYQSIELKTSLKTQSPIIFRLFLLILSILSASVCQYALPGPYSKSIISIAGILCRRNG